MGTSVPWKKERKVRRLAWKGPFNLDLSTKGTLWASELMAQPCQRLTQLCFRVWHRDVPGTVNSVNIDINSVEHGVYIMLELFFF